MAQALNPVIQSIDMPSAGTIYPYTFPVNTKRFTIQVLTGRDTTTPTLRPFKIALTVENMIAGVHWTNVGGMNYYETDILTPSNRVDPTTVYLRCPFDNAVAEIFSWWG